MAKKYEKKSWSGNGLRYVYGTADNKWHLVDSSDRDYSSGLTPEEFKRLGKKAAKEKYLQTSIGFHWET